MAGLKSTRLKFWAVWVHSQAQDLLSREFALLTMILALHLGEY